MKKLFKISAIALITFALATNLYASTVSFYGLKNVKLSKAVVAAAMSDSSGSSSGDDSSGADSSMSGSWWDSPVDRVINCGETRVGGSSTSAGTVGASVHTVTNQYGQASVWVMYSDANNMNYTQIIEAHPATWRQCIGPNKSICTTITAIEACK